MSDLPILVVGGGSGSRERVVAQLERRRYEVVVLGDRLDGTLAGAIDVAAAAVVVLLPSVHGSGVDVLEVVAGRKDNSPIIVVGTDDTIPDASTAYRLGAQDFVPSSGDIDRFHEAIGLILGTSRRDSELRYFREKAAQSTDWSAVVGKCEAMRKALRLVQQILGRTSVRATPPILITGETGTGKGLVARSIHFNSSRRHEPYVDVNCASIPAALIEAELLGHERGAFTDARVARPGLFETAHGGSLFLDEIAALPFDLQAKLLTVTEEKRVRRIGGRESKTVDVQILAATHRNLAEMVEKGEFREDLYHRLNVIRVELPPLRDRGEDKVHLAERFVEEMCNQYGLPLRDLTEGARDLVREYEWPGNVRELRNQIEQIILVADDYEIRAEHFNIVKRKVSRVEVRANAGLQVSIPPEGLSLDALERSVIKQALALCDGNVSRTARFLAISRQTLIYRLKKHDIENTG